MKKTVYGISIVFTSVFFIGCGGGDAYYGGEEPGGLVSDCSGASSCISDENIYAGNGIGVWSYKNNGAGGVDLNISISNTANKDITVVFTNEGDNDVRLPYIKVDTTLKKETYGEQAVGTIKYTPRTVRQVDLEEFVRQDDQGLPLQLQTPSYKTWSLNSNNAWYVETGEAGKRRTAIATLKKQTAVLGRTINIWVEDDEFGNEKIDDAKIDDIASNVNTIYTNVVNIAGEPWGAHSQSYFISKDQPLDVVLVNFDNDSDPGGMVGYFDPNNNFINKNEFNAALAIFIDTETYYLYGDGKDVTLSTIAHELTHAINFYQRYILMGSSNQFDVFLDEMSAVMMEDVLSKKISSAFNDVRLRYKDWLKEPLYHCDFKKWEECNGDSVYSYSVAGSFGAFLLRQYGIDFYKTLFRTSSSSSLNVLNEAIKKSDNRGLPHALRNWGASIAMFPTSVKPEGFGYPALKDGGFELEAFDGNDYKSYRKLPISSPSTLAAHAHFPFLRKSSNYAYEETFTVPKGVSVSVIVK
ncbi:MAG: hypothetical protein LBQ18_03525 [Campylobacteraceae bacterium]|jgi:hypothetical protein|nr:hypothetical protein [Campylobacteraceae bacterium]